jgi:nicotinate-nucleotide adenylyltransferase
VAEIGKPRRIGLLGGSFDPVHQAHRTLADVALNELALDQLKWVVAGRPWQKHGREMASAEHRAAMVGLAIADDPRQVIERCEIDRTGPSYTLDTVNALRAAMPDVHEWFLIIGADQYANFHTWHGWRELLDRVTLAVVARAGVEPVADAALADTPHRLRRLNMPACAVSATDIRRRLGQGVSASMLSPAVLSIPVARYIERQRLYHLDPART